MRVRPLGPEDVPAAIRLVTAALPPRSDDNDREAWLRMRIIRSLALDPDGAWLAEDGAGVTGLSLAVKREGVWVLTFLGVHPGVQSRGLGRRLIDAALGYGEDCRGFLIAASEDPRALRLYARSGFDVEPCLEARGRVDPERVPELAGVRRGDRDDLEHCAAVDRRVRGAGRTPDLEVILDGGRARLWLTAGGYVLAGDGVVFVLAAVDEEEARTLLWAALAEAGEAEAAVAWISARQGWAMRVSLDAGLRLAPMGPYFRRGELGPLAPWLPNGAFL